MCNKIRVLKEMEDFVATLCENILLKLQQSYNIHKQDVIVVIALIIIRIRKNGTPCILMKADIIGCKSGYKSHNKICDMHLVKLQNLN